MFVPLCSGLEYRSLQEFSMTQGWRYVKSWSNQDIWRCNSVILSDTKCQIFPLWVQGDFLWEKYTAVSGDEAFAEAEDLLGLERFAPRKYTSYCAFAAEKLRQIISNIINLHSAYYSEKEKDLYGICIHFDTFLYFDRPLSWGWSSGERAAGPGSLQR